MQTKVRSPFWLLLVASALSAVRADDKTTSVPLFDGLGGFGRTVTTESPQAQQYFSQGLCFLYAFNHDEAIRSFQQATRLDPACAMAWWGIAVASGPHINNPVVPAERSAQAGAALGQARAAAAAGSEIERELIAAQATRFAEPPPEDRRPLDEAYAAAMRRLWEKYHQDADVGAMFAESLMDLRPWDLWQADGDPQPGTDEIVSTLEEVLRLAPRHPLALHLYIHAVEASPQPGRADDAADRLRHLQPGLGHLVHMPSHIDVRRGRWRQASEANLRAMEADRKYREQSPQQNFYRLYMAHNHHMLAFADIMQGRSARALKSINDMVAGMPAEWVRENTAIADGFSAMPLELLVRFGRWEEVLRAPEPPEYLPLARAMRHGARGVALAALKVPERARAEQRAFLEDKARLPEGTTFGNNRAADLMSVAEHLLEGEILYSEGKIAEAIDALTRAVEHEDRLRYDEPPDWIHPVRHPLGAILLSTGRASDAEKVFRDDLVRLPNNGWSLYGLARSLEAQGRRDAAAEVQAQFRQIWSDADFELTSSCLCVPLAASRPN